jgi:hypothetical protein
MTEPPRVEPNGNVSYDGRRYFVVDHGPAKSPRQVGFWRLGGRNLGRVGWFVREADGTESIQAAPRFWRTGEALLGVLGRAWLDRDASLVTFEQLRAGSKTPEDVAVCPHTGCRWFLSGGVVSCLWCGLCRPRDLTRLGHCRGKVRLALRDHDVATPPEGSRGG